MNDTIEEKEKEEIDSGMTYKEIGSVELTPVGLGPWSFSKLKMLGQCPLQFYLKYIIKAKIKGIPIINIQTESGKAIHRILELVVMGKSIEDSFRLVKKEYENILPGNIWEEGHDDAGGVAKNELAVAQFKQRLDDFEKRHPVKRYLTELKIGVTKDWTPTGFFTTDIEKIDKNVYFRGVIDLIIQLENEDVIFLDHKRGAPSVMGVKNFQQQLDTYKVLFSKGIQEYGDAQAGVHFVNDAVVTMGQVTSKADVENTLVNRVEFNIAGAIAKTGELGFFKHIRGNHCKWCDYNDMCAAGTLKPMELETKKWFIKDDNV